MQDSALSDTDEDPEDEAETGETGAVEYPGTVVPDLHPDQIASDFDLAREYPDDTEYIDLIHLKIQSLEDLNLGRFPKLEALCLRQNLIESVGGVRDLPVDTLEELDFYDNRINHLSSQLNRLVRLKNLDLSFNKIKNIKNIDRLVGLENLYFVQNKISEIKNLRTLKSLKNLELGGNRLAAILPEMLHLPSIEQLWLGKNKIARLENLDNLACLRVLSIQSNRLTRIEGLDKLVNLEELYLSHNGIERIENLEHNANLTVLDVTSNRLTHLSGLAHLKKLTDFWCSYNQISSFNEITEQLGLLPDLDTVYFEGNPVQLTNPTAYRRKLRLCLGDSLAKIDATYVRT
ncbi:L domain-like protein [Metschnikowia bicuspidata var. bicuspidata NRRL YB-4993]|uniref:L domain-like protein n=1 Tax=Metschnikowia bicuspidata var. bicuspidata NRRL YB-4993 TaxID=869754 RepID=A0A1A0HF71_9ASCO|nr:L domain-like protein [Metschnikowia bicuspidata var. bicuspidata NRRL YB-4993]OBA22533.1 L domain-like protein [Metschnikowia bicuspidata var. bicuspidata NRRL YB-4993]